MLVPHDPHYPLPSFSRAAQASCTLLKLVVLDFNWFQSLCSWIVLLILTSILFSRLTITTKFGSTVGKLFLITRNIIIGNTSLLHFFTSLLYFFAKLAIRKEIHNIEEWCTVNKLTLNKEKPRVLLWTRNRGSLHLELPFLISKEAAFLGVTIKDKLTWKEHINKTIKKCNQRLFVLRKIKESCWPGRAEENIRISDMGNPWIRLTLLCLLT